MKNRYWVILIIFLIAIIGLGVYFSIKNNANNQQSEYEANKTSSNSPNNTSENNNSQSNNENNEENAEPNSNTETPDNPDNNTNQAVDESSQNQPQDTPPTTTEEVELASFSTKIYSSDNARQNNIQITCNTLNNTTVKSGTPFSFCTTVGKATSARGYQEADVYDNDGNKKKGLGGGNCQVSTTLYNAVAKINGITVTERHNHSNKVPYARSGKDAAVAHRKL